MSSESNRALRKVSVLVLSWNGLQHLQTCLPALRRQQDPGVEWDVLVLDNGSFDETCEWIRAEHSWVRLIESDVNLGFCAGNNRLVDEAEGADAVVLLNNDTRPKTGWLAELVSAYRQAPDDVAAVSGGIVDWQGERLDFARGILTFDGHAFQMDYRRPLEQVTLPEPGSELLFACGGNMIIRRQAYLEQGGFDPAYFAYLEDVDLGWRLWASGHRVLYAPNAVVHHRSMATSQTLGNANRGFLFERNAFLTAYKNFDDELFHRLMPAIWMTLVHRTQTLMVQNNPGGDLLTLDPYAGLIANTAAPAASSASLAEQAVDSQDTLVSRGPLKTSWGEKWRGYGPREFFRRAARKGARTLLPSWLFADPTPTTHITDQQTFAHLRALTFILGQRDRIAAQRVETQARRKRADREIFEKFPLAVVPTYPGDAELFGSRAFQQAWPSEVPSVRYRLSEIMEMDD